MEVMAMPNKETLQFYKQVRPWITNGTRKNGVMYYLFSDDTPTYILDLFESIKDKLSYKAERAR